MTTETQDQLKAQILKALCPEVEKYLNELFDTYGIEDIMELSEQDLFEDFIMTKREQIVTKRSEQWSHTK